MVIENWRVQYNTKRPQSALGYQLAARVTLTPNPIRLYRRLPIQQSLTASGVSDASLRYLDQRLIKHLVPYGAGIAAKPVAKLIVLFSFKRSSAGLAVYGLALLVVLEWSVSEIGFDRWQLSARGVDIYDLVGHF